MKIYTSYFANLKNLTAANIQPVGIVNKIPKFFADADYPNIGSVAPSDSILWEYKKSQQTEDDWSHYTERYINEILCIYRFHPEYLLSTLEFIANGNDIALCCYEAPDDRCHRHILAEWLNIRFPELNIEEYPIYTKKTKKASSKPYVQLISEPLF